MVYILHHQGKLKEFLFYNALKQNIMTTATILISGFTILVSGTYYPQFGDGFNDPYEPAHWEVYESIYNGEDLDLEQLAKIFNITESELYKICSDALSEQDRLDWELCNSFI